MYVEAVRAMAATQQLVSFCDAIIFVPPETPDEHSVASEPEMGDFFCRGKEIKGLAGGIHRYATQARTQIDAAMAEKNRLRTETNSLLTN